MKKYKDAWAWYEKWESNNEPSDVSNADVDAITYFGGQAALELARAIKKDDDAQAELRGEYLKTRQGLALRRGRRCPANIARKPGCCSPIRC